MQNSFNSLPVTLTNLLTQCLVAPCNQRAFAWGKENALKFIENAWFMFENNKVYDIGNFIFYKENDTTFVYDGQSRITISIIILKEAKAYLTPQQQNEIDRYIFLEDSFRQLTSQQKQMMEDNGWYKYPRFQSYYKSDFLSIGNYLNDCSYKNKHFKACAKTCAEFMEEIEDKSLILKFVGCFLKSSAQEKVFTDRYYAALYMNIVNNTGEAMTDVDNARNLILMYTPEDKQEEVLTILDKAGELPSRIKPMHIACFAYKRLQVEKEKGIVDATLREVVQSDEKLGKFLEILKKSIRLVEELNDYGFYKLLEKYYIESVWNIFFPTAIINNMSLEDLRWLIKRSVMHFAKHGVFSANSMTDRVPWIENAKSEWLDKQEYPLPEIPPRSLEHLQKLTEEEKKNKEVIMKLYNLLHSQQVTEETFSNTTVKMVHEYNTEL